MELYSSVCRKKDLTHADTRVYIMEGVGVVGIIRKSLIVLLMFTPITEIILTRAIFLRYLGISGIKRKLSGQKQRIALQKFHKKRENSYCENFFYE